MHRNLTSRILTFVVSFVALGLVGPPALAQGGGSCLAPSGGDDTEALQAALDGCVGAQTRCVVRLCEGDFSTRPVVVEGFNGFLLGAGQGRTIIRAEPYLEVNDNDQGYIYGDPFDELAPWPFLLQFFEGRGTIRDLSVEVPAGKEPPTQGWLGGAIEELGGAILITGQSPVDYVIEGVRIAGAPDSTYTGTTLLAGVYFQGTILNLEDPGDYPVFPVRGRLRITRSEFVDMLSGTPLAELGDANVSLTRNEYRAGYATDVIDASSSRVRIVGNRFDTTFRGIQVLLNVDGEPSAGNTFLAFSNRGAVGPEGDGFFFQDPFVPLVDPYLVDQEPGDSRVVLAYNRFEAGGEVGPAATAMGVVGAGSLTVAGNRTYGRARFGVRVNNTTGCGVLQNRFSGLDTGDGPDLELGVGTSECVARVRRRDVVWDFGANNRIIRR